MATPFENIYELFLENIEDRTLINNLSESELERTLEILLLKAANLDFPCCIKDLKKVDLKTKCFLDDLDFEEMAILSYGMVIHYFQPKVNREENYRLELGDRDFKANGRDKMLKAMSIRLNNAETKLREYVLQYQYSHHDIF